MFYDETFEDCPYALETNDGFACLKEQTFINCTGKVVKGDDSSEKIDFFCRELEEDLYFPKKLIRSFEFNNNKVHEIEEMIIKELRGGVSEEYTFGKSVILRKWPQPIESKEQLDKFNRSFVIRLGELVQAGKLKVPDFLTDSLKLKLKRR